jgi:hypothetical protein
VLLLIIAALIGWSVNRGRKKVNELVSAAHSKQLSLNKSGFATYTNAKENLPAAFHPKFVAFSFDYPTSFVLQPQSESNFVKVEETPADRPRDTLENFAVGSASFGTKEPIGDEKYVKMLGEFSQKFPGTFPNYKEIRKAPETVGGARGMALLFQAEMGPLRRALYGKIVMVRAPGKDKGVTIIILATSLDPDIKSADDLGVKGETAAILRSFRFL